MISTSPKLTALQMLVKQTLNSSDASETKVRVPAVMSSVLCSSTSFARPLPLALSSGSSVLAT
jgi:hypothetical protein